MGLYVFPADFIFWTQAKNHKANKVALQHIIKSKLDKTADAQVGTWLCNVNTEFFNQDNEIYKELITEELFPAFDALLNEIPALVKPRVATIKHIWYNHYTIGDSQEVHSHVGSTISGIYFLDLNEPNTTVFYSANASTSILVNPTKQTEFINEGDIVLFPSHLLHYVVPATKERTTIAFNIECEF